MSGNQILVNTEQTSKNIFTHFITVLRISFFLLIFELNAVVYIHSNVFYPATSTLKMLYINFFWARLVTICLLYKFFIH